MSDTVSQVLERLAKLAATKAADPAKLDPATRKRMAKRGLDRRGGTEVPAADPFFDNAVSGLDRPGGPEGAPEVKRVESLRLHLDKLRGNEQEGGRAQRFYPYLLVRSVAGDTGDRPLDAHTIPPNQSPDIWVVPGAPASAPPAPPPGAPQPIVTVGGRYRISPRAHGFADPLAAGSPHTLYAHVWNLGRAPIVGVKVEFWYAPTWVYADMPKLARLVGVARCELAPRSSQRCHRLVKCPEPFVPQPSKDGSQLIAVRVSCIGDSIESPWAPLDDRHVAFHQLTIR